MKINQLKKSLLKYLGGLIIVSILVWLAGTAYLGNMDIYKQLFRLDSYVNNSADMLELTGYNYPYKKDVLHVFGENMKSIHSGDYFQEKLNNKLGNYIANIKGILGDHEAGQFVNGDDWQRFFNEANLKLLQGYDKIKSDKQDIFIQSHTDLKDSIVLYNDAAYLLGTGDEQLVKYIMKNRLTAYYLKNLAGIKICIDTFRQGLEKLSETVISAGDLMKILDQEIEELKRIMQESEDTSIRKCMRDLYRSANESKIGIEQFQLLLEGLINDAIEKLRGYIDDPDKCVEEREDFLNQLMITIRGINQVLQEYKKSHGLIVSILVSNNFELMEMLCDQLDKKEQKDSELNQQLNQHLQELQEMMNPGQPQQGDQSQGEKEEESEEEGKGPGENEQEENKGASNEQNHYDIPEGYEKKLMEGIEKQNKVWIKEMNNIKSNEGYNPKDLLKKLFKDFYGNDEDFDKAGEDAEKSTGTVER